MSNGSHLPPNQASGSFRRNRREEEQPAFVQGSSRTQDRTRPNDTGPGDPTEPFEFGEQSKESFGGNDFAGEIVQKAETVIEDVRRRNLSKGLAVGRLYSIFDLDGDYSDSERRKRHEGFEQFMDEIEEEENVQKAAAREGKRVEKALAYRPYPGKRESRSCTPSTDRYGLPFRPREKGRSASPNGEADPAISGGKRIRIRRDQLPWAARDDEFASNTTDSSCLRNQELLRLFKLDISWTLSDIELSPTAPYGFPESEWRHILEGRHVNLDTVLGYLHFSNAPEPSSTRLGEQEITFTAAKAATHVTNAAEWTNAWDAASEAYEFVFEHRRRELRDYGNQIRRLFAARLPQAASRVIAYDDAVRKYVKGATAISLTDFHKFNHLADAHLSFDGIEAQKREGKRRAAGYGPGPSGGGRASGTCDRFNQKGGCERADGKCRFSHYMRYNDWGLPEPIRAIEWTEYASPLPSPPPSVIQDPRVARTITDHPHLFQIVTPIHVDDFENALTSHPNRPFCDSVVRSLRKGFWPFAAIPDDYPLVYEAPQPEIEDEEQIRFLRDQRDIELSRGRYSDGFRTLLDGMVRMPNFAVPKDNGSAWRQVVNHSFGPYALNLMVDKDAMGKAPLDGMRSFGPTLVEFRRRFPNARLILWKADVREAYRLIPMHPFWQVKQVEHVDGLNYVNRCNVFGGTASQILFIAFMALVNWIAVCVFAISAISEYSDDHFGVALEDDVEWYEPYQKTLPAPQAQLLRVWDRLGVPHKESKQISGNPLTIIGISVDTTTMTLSLPDDAKSDLLQELDLWCDEAGQLARKGATLKRWQQLAGWLNWAFNVFPLLRPCLANVYAKMRGKSVPSAKIRINNAVRCDLSWARDHLRSASGVHLLECAHWDPHEDADLTVFCDASLEGMGFWIRGLNLGFYAPTIDTQGEEFIFLHESLCVLSALRHIDSHDYFPSHTTVYSDNTNTVDIYNTLKASPRINPILKAASDVALESCSDFKVLFSIPGVDNQIADALSRFDFDRARAIAPGIDIQPFTPPRITLGDDV
ncbi:hypothetical protein DFP72DRAFT_1171100 [Ephemerocybe angulata]|uniref:C3H1-type domain-containing protein n=1 Tax=Ephemerocybe angulata TaxID=980116 RepID=A0A8H6HU81_9AGAR|nr:hypothetical protein DFP72DRAFT_1171100 [Tulosesus angulatus]